MKAEAYLDRPTTVPQIPRKSALVLAWTDPDPSDLYNENMAS